MERFSMILGYRKSCLGLFLFFCIVFSVSAHILVMKPSESVIEQKTGRDVSITLGFSHPFQWEGMNLEKPSEFGYYLNGQKFSLLDKLAETTLMDHLAWNCDFKFKRPGLYQFYMIQSPYWESAEECFIQQNCKVVIPAFGNESGWDKEIGLKSEIIPLTRPFGLYAGNTFQGIVKKGEKPVPFAEVSICYYNEGEKVKAKNGYLEHQTVKADVNGVFTYTVPSSGWWGFKAFVPSDKELLHDGVPKKTYTATVIWVKFENWNAE